MTPRRLLLRNLLFHWRGNLAVFLGVVVGTAVLTGALLVGDSLRGSLRDLTLQRLGWVDQALVAGRFFREKLAGELKDDKVVEKVEPAIVLQGTVTTLPGKPTDKGTPRPVRRAGKVTIWGVKESFWTGKGDWLATWKPGSELPAVLLNSILAHELHVRPGDKLTLQLQKQSAVPRETLLGRKEASEIIEPVTVQVGAVLPDQVEGAQLSLNPSPAAPRNVFIRLHRLQAQLGLHGKVNALLAGGPAPLQANLARHLTLDDWGLLLLDPESRTRALFDKLDRNRDGELSAAEWRNQVPKELAERADPQTRVLSRNAVREYYQQRGYLSLESRQLFLEKPVVEAAEVAAYKTNLKMARTLVYLANSIANDRFEIASLVAALDPTPLAALRLTAADGFRIPYSVVAALDPELPSPLGPFLPPGVDKLQADEIVLADWEQSPLQAQPGDGITLLYYPPIETGQLPELARTFRLRGMVPLKGVADDPDLTPEFPGITDKLTLKDWNPPFPYFGKRVLKRDEEYWNLHRTTPKAYVRLQTGQDMWGSRFGKLTSIRLAPTKGQDLTKASEEFRRELLQALQPQQGGLAFNAVRQQGLTASAGGGFDFGMLFLGFSFFLIAAALLLVGLLFRLNLDRRGSEVGLLLATGFPVRTVRRLLLAEGAILAAAGGLVGVLGAMLYAWGLLKFLAAYWPVSLEPSFLRLHVSAASLAIGYLAAVAVSLLTIAWAVRILGRSTPASLLAGQNPGEDAVGSATGPGWSQWLAVGATLLALVLLGMGGLVRDQEMQASTFFGGGALLLTAGLAVTWAWMRRAAGQGRLDIGSLAVRNAARHPVRSLLTAGLLASAAFLVVAVESFRQQPGLDFLEKNSGSGGFGLLAESDLPVYQDLNRGAGRQELDDALERYFRERPGTDSTRLEQQLAEAKGVLAQTTIYPLRLRGGDDASCLNLYKPGRPRLLGVPHALIERGGFQFGETFASLPEERANPWLLLEHKTGSGAVPVFGEENTVTWMLGSKLGGEITVPNEAGDPVKLRIVGLLKNSVFQSELVMSEASFLILYPTHQGYQFFLIQSPPQQQDQVKTLLEAALSNRGFEVTPAAQRLAAYLAIENTYLSTFQALGGLGLLLGTLGLAVVLLRSVWERRAELALLRALGFRRKVLGWLVLAENAAVLAVGLGVGTVAALLSVAPHVLAGGGGVPWLHLLGLLVLVVLVGLTAGLAALAATLRAPLLLLFGANDVLVFLEECDFMESRLWIVFVALAGLCWGTYVPLIARGGKELKSSYASFLCVGLAYFLIAILVPIVVLWVRGKMPNITASGITLATLAGVAGALGALCVIFATFEFNGPRLYVAPLIFATAPVINTLVSLVWHPTEESAWNFALPTEIPHWTLFVGIILTGLGAGLVLYSKEFSETKHAAAKPPPATIAANP